MSHKRSLSEKAPLLSSNRVQQQPPQYVPPGALVRPAINYLSPANIQVHRCRR